MWHTKCELCAFDWLAVIISNILFHGGKKVPFRLPMIQSNSTRTEIMYFLPYIAPATWWEFEEKHCTFLNILSLFAHDVLQLRKLLSISILMVFNFHWKLHWNRITIDDGPNAKLRIKWMLTTNILFIHSLDNITKDNLKVYFLLSMFPSLFSAAILSIASGMSSRKCSQVTLTKRFVMKSRLTKAEKKQKNEKENAMVWKPSRASACVSDKITHFKWQIKRIATEIRKVWRIWNKQRKETEQSC